MLSFQFTYQQHRLVIWRSFFHRLCQTRLHWPKQKLKQQTSPMWTHLPLVFCPCLKHTKDSPPQTSILPLGSPSLLTYLSLLFHSYSITSDAVLPNFGNSEMESEGLVSLSKLKIHRNKAECRHWETNVPRPHAENAFVWYSKWVPFSCRKRTKKPNPKPKKTTTRNCILCFRENRYLVYPKAVN